MNESSDLQSPDAASEAAFSPVVPRILYPSWIERFRRCEKSFYLAHVVKEKQAREPSPQLTLGNAVHDALARFFRLPVSDRQPENLERSLRSVWTKHRTPETFFSAAEERACGLAGLEMLRRYAESHALDAPVLATEQAVRHRLPNGALLAGYIDRIDRSTTSDGLELIDYKTGRSVVEPDEMPDDPAAQIYALGAASTYRQTVTAVRFSYLALDRDVVWMPEPDGLVAIEQRLIALTDEIYAREEFPAFPGEQCRWCDFQLRCPERQLISLDELVPVEGLPF